MKSLYLKEHGKVIEKIELQDEQKFIFIKYARGSFKKSAYIIKSDPVAAQNALDQFLDDCLASDEIIADLKDPLKKGQQSVNRGLQEFVNFLIVTSSVHIMVGIALGICIYGGYLLGAKLDETLNNSPSLTVIGILWGLGMGCLAGYMIMLKYLDHLSAKGVKKAKARKKLKDRKTAEDMNWPSIDASLKDIRYAVRMFSNDLPVGINKNILVKEDHQIDFEKLAPYLKGIPNKPFYMSKETHEIFEEKDQHIPVIIDKVQEAVYLFYRVYNQYPIMPYDPLHRVNYFQLMEEHFLEKHPGIDLYFTGYEGLITHNKPQKKHKGIL